MSATIVLATTPSQVLLRMFRQFLPLLLAPLSVLTDPTSSSDGQSVSQFPNSPVVENVVSAAPLGSGVQLIYQFEPMIALENLTPRSNGQLLLTSSGEPSVYSLDPSERNQPPKLLYQFPNASSALGIAEIAHDIFAVVVGNFSSPVYSVPGSFSIWSINLTTSTPTTDIIASMPEAAGLNGATNLDGSLDILLIADSALGTVWRLNLTTRDYSIAIQDPLFSNWSSPVYIGINGIRTSRGSLFFSNSAQGTFGRVPISNNGSATGQVEIIARLDVPQVEYDDFDIDWAGTAWVATHPNSLNEVSFEGAQRNFTGKDAGIELKQPTAARFGRGSKREENTLYVVTATGQVIALDTGLLF